VNLQEPECDHFTDLLICTETKVTKCVADHEF